MSQSLKNGFKNGPGGLGGFYKVVLENKTGKMNISVRSIFLKSDF